MSDTMEQSLREVMLKRKRSDTKSLLMTKHEYFCCLKRSKLHLTSQRSPTGSTISLAGYVALSTYGHGKPRHPESQGLVERLNCDVKDILTAWLGDNDSTDWPTGLRFVQFQKNSGYRSGIKQSPFKALFGRDAQVGLRSASLPSEILERLVSEDDLMAAYQQSDPSQVSSGNQTTVSPNLPHKKISHLMPQKLLLQHLYLLLRLRQPLSKYGTTTFNSTAREQLKDR
ncbi:KRAB-A domain-containing protein 2-like [Oopsacas minuta]|uniref:KRAB-A domain-containing protein 2-like n=1 Tax=Oopsacas minuta TaxID=111878 RepID=A0AAV7KGP3_9METZ|nr:KRAB-A domain-containing protein 2-like [Oopsacas minuta]